jgi:hypothetical protein
VFGAQVIDLGNPEQLGTVFRQMDFTEGTHHLLHSRKACLVLLNRGDSSHHQSTRKSNNMLFSRQESFDSSDWHPSIFDERYSTLDNV